MAAFPSPATIFATFALGIELVIGLILGLSTGLSELHKTVLVGFVVVFPLLALALIWMLITRVEPDSDLA